MKRLLTALAAVLTAVVAQFALADTLGTWLLNGMDGDKPAGGTVIPNLTQGSSLEMSVLSEAGKAPFYSKEAMPAFGWEVHSSKACDDLLGTISAPLYLRKEPLSAKNVETAKGVEISGFGSAVNPAGTCGSWTIECIVRYPESTESMTPLFYITPVAGAGANTFAVASVNAFGIRLYYFTRNEQTGAWNALSNTGAMFTTVGKSIYNGEWHHLAMTYDATTRALSLFVDYGATPFVSATLTAGTLDNAIDSTSKVVIGPNTIWNSFAKTYPYQELAAVRISSGVLSPSEFIAWTAPKDAVLGLWKFDGADGASETERIVNLAGDGALDLNPIVSEAFPKYAQESVPQNVKLYSDLSMSEPLGDVSSSLKLADATYPASGRLRVDSGVGIAGFGKWTQGGDFTIEFIARYAVDLSSAPVGPMAYFDSPTVSSWAVLWQNGQTATRLSYIASAVTNKDLTSRDRQETPCEGGWHHIALVYTQATKTISTFIDYAKIDVLSYTFADPNGIFGAVGSDAVVKLGPNTPFNGWMNALPQQQLLAVRVTKSALAVEKFMTWATEKMATGDTIAHWRFDGVAGEKASVFADAGCPSRSDLRWYAAVWEDNDFGFDSDIYGKYRQLKIDGVSLANATALGSMNSPISLHSSGPCIALSKDFTFECFFMLNEYPSTGNARAILYEEWGKNDKFFRVVCSSENKWDPGYQRFVVCAQVAKQDGTFEERKIIPASAIELKKWHRFALVIRESVAPRQMEYWLDGELVGTVALAEGESFVRSAKGFYMGSTYSNTAHPEYDVYNEGNFFGKIDEVRVSRKALAPSEFIDREKFGFFLMVK